MTGVREELSRPLAAIAIFLATGAIPAIALAETGEKWTAPGADSGAEWRAKTAEESRSEGIGTQQAADAPSSDGEQPPSLAAALAIPGITPRVDLTGFVDVVAAGDGDDDPKFTGRVDLFTDFSSEGLGLWKGTMLRTHFEWRESETGAAATGRAGAVLPINTGAFLPNSGEGPELTSLYVFQNLGPATFLMVGKINAVDLLESDPFYGGMGNKRFQNIAFVAPPSGVIPPVIMGGMLIHQEGPVGITAMLFDPKDRTHDYWVDGLFASGVNMSLGGKWGGAIDGRSSSIGLTATYSSARGVDFRDILLPPEIERSTKKGSYNIALQFSHLLVPAQSDSSKGLGLYGQAAISDGNPNAIQSFFIGGLAGHALIQGRENDSFGIGGFYYNFSNSLQSTASPLVDLNDEAGLEAWYSFAFSPNVALSLDAQLIDTSLGAADTAFVVGARLGASF